MRNPKAARLVAILYVLVLTGLILAPRPFATLGQFAPTAQWLVGPGYWTHFALYFLLSLLLFRAFAAGVAIRPALLALFIAAHGSVTEWCQNFVPGREVDPLDLLFNLLGGLLGGVTWFVASKRRESRSSQSYRPFL